MPKERAKVSEKKKGLTDAELIKKYGDLVPAIPVDVMVKAMLSKPSKSASAKSARV